MIRILSILLVLVGATAANAADSCPTPAEWTAEQKQAYESFRGHHPVDMSIRFTKQELNLPSEACPEKISAELIGRLCGISGCTKEYLTYVSLVENQIPSRIVTVAAVVSFDPGSSVPTITLLLN